MERMNRGVDRGVDRKLFTKMPTKTFFSQVYVE